MLNTPPLGNIGQVAHFPIPTHGRVISADAREVLPYESCRHTEVFLELERDSKIDASAL
jgi:hypothetical protein